VTVNVWRLALIVVTALWGAATFASWERLASHAYRQAATTSGVATWPQLGADFLADEKTRIVVFAHPGCPCTRATVAELAEVLADCPADASAAVVFVTAGLPDDVVSNSDTVAAARQTNNVIVVLDDDAQIAARYGATVSGETFAFNAAGRRIFHGGITAARGHRGTSGGRELLEQAIRNPAADTGEAPVFGCRLATN
jgi:hypothetical protein